MGARKESAAELPILPFEDAVAFDRYLEAGDSAGVWVRLAKKGSGIASVSYAEAVEVALCHGWIDGQSRSLDEQTYLQRFTPRRAKSIWSKINVEKVGRLIDAGRMRPAGLAEVERAKADGRWDVAYAGAATMEVPAELEAALARSAAAKEAFAALDKSNRYAFCHRVATAVKPETRAARAQKAVELLLVGALPHPIKAAKPKPPPKPKPKPKRQSRDS